MRGGHECVVYDIVAEGGGGSWSTRRRDRRRLARRTSSTKLDEAARGLADGARRRSSTRRSPTCCPLLEPGDIIIDGGNSYYVDDIRRAKRARAEGHPLRRRRHQRRRLGPRARLLPDDRRRDRGRAAPRPDLRDAGARHRATSPRTPGREKLGGTAEHGYLHCGPNGAGHFVKMVHNGIEYGLMAAYAEGLNILRTPTSASSTHDGRRRDDAAARPRALPVRPQPRATSPRSGGAAA